MIITIITITVCFQHTHTHTHASKNRYVALEETTEFPFNNTNPLPIRLLRDLHLLRFKDIPRTMVRECTTKTTWGTKVVVGKSGWIKTFRLGSRGSSRLNEVLRNSSSSNITYSFVLYFFQTI